MAMRLSNIKMTTKVNRTDLLTKLLENLAEHKKIVEEAQEGYLEELKKTLRSRLEQIETDGTKKTFYLQIIAPEDHSEVYENSIEMLRWNEDEYVVLEADEFRQLVRNEWDWMEGFLAENAKYSVTAASKRAGI